jgi:hypothetical protein
LTNVQYSVKRPDVARAGRFESIARVALLGSGLVLGPACSDFGSEIDPARPTATDAAPGTGGAAGTGGTGGTGGAPGSGGAMPPPPMGSGGSNPGSGGSPGSPDAAPPSGEACPTTASFAILLSLDVTWVGNAATTSGTGKVHIWNKADLMASGTTLSGQVTPCGTELPETTLSGLGRVAAGGSKILIQIPETVWDAPSMPKFPLVGTRASAALGAAIEINLAAPLGYKPAADLRATWPESYTGLRDQLLDPDGEGKPGYLAMPKPDGGYVLPPTSLGLGGLAPAAERLALVSRNLMTLAGTRTSCEAFAGTANVTAFDSHVVGCVLRGGGECSPAQVDFVDQNRMKYVPKGATFMAVQVAAAATCAEVRRALH